MEVLLSLAIAVDVVDPSTSHVKIHVLEEHVHVVPATQKVIHDGHAPRPRHGVTVSMFSDSDHVRTQKIRGNSIEELVYFLARQYMLAFTVFTVLI